MYKNNKLWNRYFPRSQRISYWYRETPWCPNIYFIDLNQFLLLFLLIITKQKYFSSSPKLFFLITFSLNLPCSLWFDPGTLRIILLWSPALGSGQAIIWPLEGRRRGFSLSSSISSSITPAGVIFVFASLFPYSLPFSCCFVCD